MTFVFRVLNDMLAGDVVFLLFFEGGRLLIYIYNIYIYTHSIP